MAAEERQPEEVHAEQAKQRRGGVVSWFAELALVVVIALVISALLRAFMFQIFEIPSGSMENTLRVNDRVAAVKVTDFKRGDIVVFEDSGGWLSTAPKTTNPVRRVLELTNLLPDTSRNYLIKRVIGLPGDHVTCCDPQGRLQVNGVSLDENAYLYSVNGVQVKPSEIDFDIVVPRDRIFVMGDHRDKSGDSRYHLCDAAQNSDPRGMTAFVSIRNVVGPTKAVVAPLNRIQGFGTPSTFADIPSPGAAPAVPSISVEGSACR